MTRPSDQDLKELLALEGEATEKEWVIMDGWWIGTSFNGRDHRKIVVSSDEDLISDEDMRLICKSRNVLKELILEVQESRDRIGFLVRILKLDKETFSAVMDDEGIDSWVKAAIGNKTICNMGINRINKALKQFNQEKPE